MSIGLFIDGAYLINTFRYVDFIKLREHIEYYLDDSIEEGFFFNASSYSPKADSFYYMLEQPPPRGPGLVVKNYWLKTKSLYWPDHLGGEMVTHPKIPETFYEQTTQKAVDVGLVFHMVSSYHRCKWKKLVLIAGDADFHEPVQHLVENEKVKLYLVGSMITMAEVLRSHAFDILEVNREPLHSRLMRKNAHS